MHPVLESFEAAPAVPGRDAGIRTPRFRDAVTGFTVWKFVEAVESLNRHSHAQVAVRKHELSSGNVLDFEVPILFQKKPIGQVHLGIYEAPLTAVANLVLVLLAILTVVTVAAVAGGTYLLAQRLAVPIRVLKNSLAELANGRFDYRIAETRKDEFGEVYAEFDKTAAALEKRYEASAGDTTIAAHPTSGR